jgi:hypothetical protein
MLANRARAIEIDSLNDTDTIEPISARRRGTHDNVDI